MLKNQKNKKKLLILSSVIMVTPLSISLINSCNKNNDNNQQPIIPPPLENVFEQQVNEWFKQEKLILKPSSLNHPDLPRIYFEKYINDFDKLSKLFVLENKTNEDIEYKFVDIKIVGSNRISYSLNINIKNNSKYAIFSSELEYNFSSLDFYYQEIIKILNANISFKEKYKEEKIITLFSQTITNKEFIETYIDQTYLENYFIGINIKLEIPTQVINNIYSEDHQQKPYIKLDVHLFNSQANKLINTIPYSIKLSLASSNVTPITIFNQDDLAKDIVPSLNAITYFGKLFIRPNEKLVTNKIVINFNFENKNIVNELDFSNFLNIEFSQKSKFSTNSITKLIFNDQSTINFLSNRTFYANLINEVSLPKIVLNINIDTFDSNVKVYGIESLENLKSLIDYNNNLNLRNIQTYDELQNIVGIVNKIQKKRENLIFNKILLPNIKGKSIKLDKLICNEVEFFNDNDKEYEFSLNISNWEIKNKIHIPKFIIKINSSLLPTNVKITRDFNDKISRLIVNGKLDMSKTIEGLDSSFGKEKLMNLDLSLFFNSFNNELANQLEINTLIFSEPIISSLNNFKNWTFFFNQQNNNKEIIFNSNVNQININLYNDLKKLVNKITRVDSLSINSIIENGTLNLKKLYDLNPVLVKVGKINELLVGHHEYINDIQTQDIDTIEKNTFAQLDEFSNYTIDLSNIKIIKANAFYKQKMNLITSNFQPEIIEEYAFYESSLEGNLDLSKAKSNSIEPYTFYNTNITNVILSSSITTIKSYAFYNCKNLKSINLENINSIGSSSFYSTSLEAIRFSNSLSSIGSSSFSNIATLKSISNLDLNKFNLIDVFGTSSNVYQSINFNITIDQIYKNINFNPVSKILDLSNLSTTNSSIISNLKLLFSQYNPTLGTQNNPINQLILPVNEWSINLKFLQLFNNKYVDRLTWNYSVGSQPKSLPSYWQGMKIKTLDDNFFYGVDQIPNNCFKNMNLVMDEINLFSVREVGAYAFSKNNIKKFVANDVEIIKEYSFDSTIEFEIGQNVKLEDTSFSQIGVINSINSKITRNKIFSESSKFSAIYQIKNNKKILDFTKSPDKVFDPKKPWIVKNLEIYSNICQYLLNKDVDILILPKSYILPTNLFNDLGDVEQIIFQEQNQQILSNAFKGTNVKNKPKLSQTNIILDPDNFLEV